MKIIKNILIWLSSIPIGIIVAILVSTFVFHPTKVLGKSMEPTIKPNKHIYVSKLEHTFSYQPRYGDIVIIDSRIHHPRTVMDDFLNSPVIRLFLKDQPHYLWIKRVIGLPSDVIEIKNNQLYRNGKLLKEDYIKEKMNTPDLKIKIPDGKIFVLGDNRNQSLDSRQIGCIPLDHVIGVKIF
ncbi:MAG: signal peptidase I [Thermoactinomyces sp.]